MINLPSLYKAVYLFIVAAFIGAVGIYLTLQYELVEGMVSWFFPHGPKVAALFLFPFRWWLVFLFGSNVGDSITFGFLLHGELDTSYERLSTFAFFTVSEICTAALIKYLANKLLDGELFRINNIMWLIILGILYRLIYMTFPAIFQVGFFADIPAEKFYEYFISQQLSGYLIGFYFLTLHLLWQWNRSYPVSWQTKNTKLMVILLFGLVIFVSALYLMKPEVAYLLRIGIFIPLVLLAARFGWLGGMFTAVCINTGLFIFLYGQEGAVLLEYQPFMLSYLLVAMLISAVMYEHKQSNSALLKASDNLVSKNNELSQMTTQLREMARNIMDIQEKERKFLSQELHDEIGQNVIALKTAIRMLELNSNKAQEHNATVDFSILKQRSDEIYSSVYQLMHWLRPIVLDDFGLYHTITGKYFQEKLEDAGIEYEVQRVDQVELSHTLENAIYRITQEAVNNTIKHSNATTFSISLCVEKDMVNLTLGDDGDVDFKPSAPVPSGQFGLESIYNRVATLNGYCSITRNNGFTLHIQLPLTPPKVDI